MLARDRSLLDVASLRELPPAIPPGCDCGRMITAPVQILR
jgi:hypothetical protein